MRPLNLLVAPSLVWGRTVLKARGYRQYASRDQFESEDGQRWMVAGPGMALTGHRFARITVLASSIGDTHRDAISRLAAANFESWMREVVLRRLALGGRLEAV